MTATQTQALEARTVDSPDLLERDLRIAADAVRDGDLILAHTLINQCKRDVLQRRRETEPHRMR